MIEVEELTKVYGPRVAVSNLSFSVGQGEVVGFLGPNGAGKTTTLRILSGFLGPTNGRVRVLGHDVVDEPLAARQKLGYMPETCPSYPELRVSEYLHFRAELKGVPRSRRVNAVERALGLANLGERRGSLVGHLSKGYRQRLGLADALVADPPLLILDEPTSGLDPNQIREVRQVIRQLAEQHTVLLSTHILAEVEAVCDRAIVIHRGKLVAQGSLDELRGRGRAGEGSIVVRGPRDAMTDDAPVEEPPTKERTVDAQGRLRVPAELEASLLEVQQLDAEHQRLRLRLPDGQRSMERWLEMLVGAGYRVGEARLGSASLEQVFAELTETTLDQASPPDAQEPKP